MTDSFEVAQWVLETPELVGESLQIAPLKLTNGNPIVATTEECCCPFDLSSQQESANRKNLDLRLSQDWENRVENMGSNIINLVAGDSEKYFTEKLEAEEIPQRFNTLCMEWRILTHLRVKVQTKGADSARYWDKQKQILNRLSHMLGVPLEHSYSSKG